MPHLQDENLAIRLQNVFEELAKDKKAMEEIKNRNLIQIIFSNSTRDLARAAISQSATIAELNNVIQDILGICKNSSRNTAAILQSVQKWQTAQNEANTVIGEDIDYLYSAVEQQLRALKNLQLIVVSIQQVETVCLDVKAISKKKTLSAIRQFLQICESIKSHISSSWITFDHKRKIYLTVEDAQFSELRYDEINAEQEALSRIFEDADFWLDKPSEWTNFLRKQVQFKEMGCIKMSDAVKEVIDATTISEADRYTEFRDQLAGLLTEFINKGIDVDNRYLPELTSIRKRLLESQFEIALVGEFQGGKSTTFNTLCGGREISPRGLNGGGIKTSAAVITAQNVSDGETKEGLSEWAEITWLSVDEIKRRIFDVLNVPLEKTDVDLAELIQQDWASNPKREELDKLRIATLQYRLISSAQYEQYASKKVVGITDFQEIVKFPQNWEPRWTKGNDADFSLEECLFSCIDNVLVRIKSPTLEKLGCRITDCPGLFVSRWDTEKAITVMKRANAIWYLLSGEKQIGHDGDGKILQLIKDWHFDEKCFLSINRRKNRKMTEQLLETDVAMLKSYGFDSEKLFKYNAILSFRLAQIELQRSGFSEKDLECLAMEYKPNDSVNVNCIVEDFQNDSRWIFKALKKVIKKILSTLDEDDLADKVEEAELWDSQLLAELNVEAGFNEIAEKIKQLITTQKARSILVTHGAKKCRDVLDAMKVRQENIIRDAEKSVEQAEREVKAAQEKLEKFIATWKKEFGFLSDETLDEGLTSDFFSSRDYDIFNELDEKSRKIVKTELRHFYWTPDRFNKGVEKKIKDEFREVIAREAYDYLNGIEDRDRFKEKIGDKIDNKFKQLKEEWQDLQSADNLLKELTLGDIEKFESNADSIDDRIDGKMEFQWSIWTFLKVFVKYTRDNTYEEVDKFFEEKNPIRKAFNEFKGENANRKAISNYLGQPRVSYKDQLDERVKKMETNLESAIKSQCERLSASKADRENAVNEAEKVLSEIIEPYQRKISEFEDKVCRVYA